MNRTKVYSFAALVVAGAFWLAAPLLAHHSAAMFDNTKTTELTGTVKEFQWANPHIWIQVNVDKAGTKEEWSFEGGSPNTLIRLGVTKYTVKIGTELTIEGYQAKEATNKAVGRNFVLPDGTRLFLSLGSAVPGGAPAPAAEPVKP